MSDAVACGCAVGEGRRGSVRGEQRSFEDEEGNNVEGVGAEADEIAADSVVDQPPFGSPR